jgi:hypothetical protein
MRPGKARLLQVRKGEKSTANEVYIGDYFLEEPQHPREEENDMEDDI